MRLDRSSSLIGPRTGAWKLMFIGDSAAGQAGKLAPRSGLIGGDETSPNHLSVLIPDTDFIVLVPEVQPDEVNPEWRRRKCAIVRHD